eukprot:gnl/MRDRNA2_/MRDRNA2_28425_c0_seq1.p1 gnl/MRDRNA2_/MRDRNA2_28425_c0~~gnl/MRDRNA2_/MRDRNA2_28425_c0_seq1.p1  ORF type:complete len:822 (-),score=225.65 gnl/MRDRNA2_/MRDRNA2_28425_c0_seq1:43-2508(-)
MQKQFTFFEANDTQSSIFSTCSEVQPEPETSALHSGVSLQGQHALSHSQLLSQQLQEECLYLKECLRQENGAFTSLKSEHQQEYEKVWAEAEQVGAAKERAAWTAKAQALRAKHTAATAAAASTKSTHSGPPAISQVEEPMYQKPGSVSNSVTEQQTINQVPSLQTNQADAFDTHGSNSLLKIKELEAEVARLKTDHNEAQNAWTAQLQEHAVSRKAANSEQTQLLLELRQCQIDLHHAQAVLDELLPLQDEFQTTQSRLRESEQAVSRTQEEVQQLLPLEEEVQQILPLQAELSLKEELLVDGENQIAQIQGQLHELQLQSLPWKGELEDSQRMLFDSEQMVTHLQEQLAVMVPQQVMEQVQATQIEKFQEEMLHSQRQIFDSEQKTLEIEAISAGEVEHSNSEVQHLQSALSELASKSTLMEHQIQESLMEASKQANRVEDLSMELAQVQQHFSESDAKLNAQEAVKYLHLKHAVCAEKAAQDESKAVLDRAFRVELAISLAAAEGNAEPAVRESAARAENCFELAKKAEDAARSESCEAAKSFQAMLQAATGVAEAAEVAEASATEEVQRSREDQTLAREEVSALRQELAGIHASGALDQSTEAKSEGVQTYITVASDFTVVDQKTVAGWQVELARWRSECATLRAECQVASLQRSCKAEKSKEEGPRFTLGLSNNGPLHLGGTSQYPGGRTPFLDESEWELERASLQAEVAELQSECAALSMQEEAMLQQVSLEIVQAIGDAEDREAIRNAEHQDVILQLRNAMQQAEERMSLHPTLEHGMSVHQSLQHVGVPRSDGYDFPPTSLGPIAHDSSTYHG